MFVDLNSSNLLSASIGTISSIDVSTAADKDATLDDPVGGLGLRSGACEGVGVRDLDVDERLRSCLRSSEILFARWKCNFSLIGGRVTSLFAACGNPNEGAASSTNHPAYAA